MIAPVTAPVHDTRSGRPWWLVSMVIPIGVAAIAWIWGRPWLVSDTATGLLAWRHWRAGGPWNCIVEPDPANLANNVASWVSWWSPGQYVWPGLFVSSGLELGAALIASAVVAAWIRSTGFFLLLSAVGLSSRTAGIAAAVEAANWHLFSSFGMYMGGEVIQAAVFPWLLLALFHLRKHIRWWLLAVPALLFAGAFAKHSMLIAGCAGVAWLWWEANATGRASWSRWLGTAVLLASSVLLARWAISAWIIGAGPTPASAGNDIHGWFIALGYPTFAPLSAATGLGSLIGRLFAVLQTPTNSGWQSIAPWLLPLAPVWLTVYILLVRHSPSTSFRRLFVATLAVYFAAMTLLYFRGASVSVEDRHVRPAGMLIIAAIAAVACTRASLPRWTRFSLYALLFGIAGYGLTAEIARASNLARLDCVGPSGISQPDLSRAAATDLLRRDNGAPAGSQIVFVGQPSIALEIQHSRLISTDAIIQPLDWFRQRRWHGRVPYILLVLPATWIDDPREAALRACFVDYTEGEWRREIVGNCLFVCAADKPVT